MSLGTEQLKTSLDTAVPLWIHQFRDLPEEERFRMIREISPGFTERMEYVLHNQEGKTADAFNDLARAIALMSFLPGGVNCFGRHWETKSEV